jgi:hypothetical protein
MMKSRNSCCDIILLGSFSLGCDSVSLPLRVLILHSKILLSSSRCPLVFEAEGTIFLQNFSKHLPGKAASCPRRCGSSTKLEWKHHISCKNFILTDMDRRINKAVDRVISFSSLPCVVWINYDFTFHYMV